MPNWRILIVDDEEDIRKIVKASLSTKYEVVEACDGLDALAKLELAEPDFVVLDVMMPLMDGFQACAAIRRHPRFKRVPVLFLSALSTTDDMKKGYGAGANLYLTKPFDPARLLRNVDVFFETQPPAFTRKRYTLDELKELQTKGSDALAHAHAEQELTLEDLEEDLEAEMHPQAPGAPRAAAAPPAEPTAPVPPAEPAWYEGRSISRPSQMPREAPPLRSQRPPRPRLLVVDDDEDLLLTVRGFLMDDYELAFAVNGIEAIEKVTAYQPDIIVLDAMMPKMSGYQLCQSLRRNARFTKTPILFMSAKTTPREREYALKIGGNEFLPKPFESGQLQECLQKIQSAPGFTIQPKAITVDALIAMENRRKAQLEGKLDRLHRKEETELEKFLRENT